MVPVAMAKASPMLFGHLAIGCSTGYMRDKRGHWAELVEEAAETSTLAIELSALSETELPGLVEYLGTGPQLPFRYVSVHGPSKGRVLSDARLVEALGELPRWIDAIVLHPDTIQDFEPYRALGRMLVIENMDLRKEAGRTVEELAEVFAALPDAGLCFDIAHAKEVDPTLGEGMAILDEFGGRLRHVHLSSLDADSHHVPMTCADEELFAPLLMRCRDVPWVLEAPLRSS